MKKILITGGAGFIGTNLISKLAPSGEYEIFVLDNESLGKREHISEEVNFINGDIADENIYATLPTDLNCVVHLAALTRVIDSIKNPELAFQSNIIGTFNLFNFCKKNGIKTIVQASTGGAIIGEPKVNPIHEDLPAAPTSPYGATKLACEGIASSYNSSYDMNISSLRFSNVYGPKSFHKGSVVAHFFKLILANKPITVYGDGEQTRDFIFIDDLINGITSALNTTKPNVYQLATGKPFSVNQLISEVKAICEKDNFLFDVIHEPARKGEVYKTWCDISRAKENLDFNPDTSVKSGLKKTWTWFKENYEQ